MAILVKGSSIYLADVHAPIRFSGFSGEALSAAAPCYLKSDGLVWMSGSAIVDEANHPMFIGMTVAAVSAANMPVTLFGVGSRIHVVDSGLTIGTRYWSGSTAGALSDTKLGTADTPIAKAVSATDLLIVRDPY